MLTENGKKFFFISPLNADILLTDIKKNRVRFPKGDILYFSSNPSNNNLGNGYRNLFTIYNGNLSESNLTFESANMIDNSVFDNFGVSAVKLENTNHPYNINLNVRVNTDTEITGIAHLVKGTIDNSDFVILSFAEFPEKVTLKKDVDYLIGYSYEY